MHNEIIPLNPSGKTTGIKDNNGRIINYLRLSITDRCNLRCIYCMPEEGFGFIPHDEILTYEEMLHIVRLCALQGIRKVRLTGGEPLVRKGIISFIERLHRIDGLEEITLTTNGVLLKDFARPLLENGIRRINVSMDTLKPEKFRLITGRDCFNQVWEGIEEAEKVGLNPIKINIVAMKGMNDDEILDFARLTYKKPYHVRFIEIMPVGDKNPWSDERFLSVENILRRIECIGPLRPVNSKSLDGPSSRYTLEGAKGEIGFIGALSNHFCKNCNRLRMTADGNLRGCLFSDHETKIKTPIRQGLGDSHLVDLIKNTIINKPINHGLNVNNPRKCARSMNSMGG
jgi:GTP 3',8-cyclase